jgi:transposase
VALTQLRCEPRAKAIYANARANGHTKEEARRILKRHLSDVVYRRMIRDLEAQLTAHRPTPPGRMTVRGRRAVKGWPDRAERSEPQRDALDGDRWPRATIPQGALT